MAGCNHYEKTHPKGKTPPRLKVVNSICPIMEKKVDPANVPPELMRTHRGQVVGFCCTPCLTDWDNLSDAQRQAKLDKAMELSAKATTEDTEKNSQ